MWILLEILRRAFPEKAERVGYKECKTAEEFNKYFDAFTDKGFNKFLAKCESQKPGWAEKIKKDIETQGWSTIKTKKYNQYPYHKPFGTPSGKIEIYAFQSFKNEAYEKALLRFPVTFLRQRSPHRSRTAMSSSWLPERTASPVPA